MLIKLDKNLKEKAQKTASELGLPLSAIIVNCLKTFVSEKQVVFSAPYEVNVKTAKILDKALKEMKEGKTFGPFDTVEALMKSLNS